MNKKLLVGMFSTIMALAPWSGYAAQTIDAPHRTVDSTNLATEDDCTSCHFTNYDVTLPEGACERCHKANTPPYGDTIAPVVMTHKNLKCQACHNPHVSLQASGIAGAFTGVTYDAVNNKSTLTGVSPTPDASWAAKTGAERGMIMWVAAGADNLSYEVKAVDATANTVTVSGNVTTTAGAFDLRRGQLIAKKVSKTAGNSYRQGDLAVQFPSAGSSSIFVDTVNATSPTGVCQVCHTTTAHWTSNGAGTNHNATRVCTECHTHDTGFLVTACNACHQGVGLDGVPVDAPGLAQPPTGSVTAGQHQIHAVDYAMPCTTCHTGTGMDRINNPTNPVKDAKIQIGFSTTKYPQGYKTTYDGQSGVIYEGTNHTTVTNTGTMTCSTVYCHSNGHSVRMNCGTAVTNTSLKWDGTSPDPQGDAIKCNNCHGFKTAYTNPMVSGRHIGPHSGYDCYYCHADTVDATNAIFASGRANHANGVYNVKAGGGMTFTYDPSTKKCSSGGCHMAYSTAWTGPSTTYPSGYTDPETCPDACAEPGAMVNLDPVIAWQTTNVDNNTVLLVDVSTDPDRVDPVKSFCQGGGFNGSDGVMKVQNALDTKISNLNPGAYLNGAAQPSAAVARTFRSEGPDKVLDTADPANPKAWFIYVVADNGPLSRGKINLGSDVPDDGVVRSGWFAHTMTPVDNATVNQNPILDWIIPTAANGGVVRTGANTCRITITNLTVDPDADVPAKKTLFGAGHDGSIGRQRIFLLNAADAVTSFDTGYQGVTYPNNAPANTTISIAGIGAPGYKVWYQFLVRDNHYVAIPADRDVKSFTVSTGWMGVTLP